jgi:nucleoside-diphosphate-sugar epimerase
MTSTRHYRPAPRRLRRPTVLLVGCGDVGARIGAISAARHAAGRLRVLGTSRSAARDAELRAIGIVPLRADLDQRGSLARLSAFVRWMIHLAPPPADGLRDPRTTRLIAAASRTRSTWRRRWVYLSTTGVYGDCGGARFDETRTVAPANARAVRRVAAERRFRAAAAQGLARASILRVPGIYDSGARLPLERLRKGLPALTPEDDVFTNHVHADDLARISLLALFRGRAARVVHAVDDSEMTMGEYFDRVADAAGLPRPPRLNRTALAAAVSPMMLSFMSESRRLENHRLRRELRARLVYPTVEATLAEFRRGLIQSQARR